MAGDVIYAFRVTRLPLLDAGGAQIGRIEDIAARTGRPGKAPRVVGFVANSQRRRIFVTVLALANLMAAAPSCAHGRRPHPFRRRAGETLIGAEIIDQSIASGESVMMSVSNINLTMYATGGGVDSSTRPPARAEATAEYRLVDWRGAAALCCALPRWRQKQLVFEICTPPMLLSWCAPFRNLSVGSWRKQWTTSVLPTCSKSYLKTNSSPH